MSKIEELIKEKCPDGVQYQRMSEVCHIVAGGDAPKENMSNEKTDEYTISIYSNGIGDNALYGYTNEAKIFEKCVTISARGTIGWASLRTEPFYPIVRLICAIPKDKEEILTEYLYYFIQTLTFQVPDGGIPQLTVPMIGKKEIPIPPIEIQEEIVRILDKFTELETELQAELEVRKKQYAYYRKKLLEFNDSVLLVTLPEISVNLDKKRKPITGNQREKGDVPYYGASGVVDYVKDFLFDGDYLLVSEDGANLIARVTPIAFSISGRTWVNNHAHILQFQTDIERKFVAYYLNSIDLSYYITGAAQPKLNQDNLNKIPIPNPPFEEKRKIVEMLDIFSEMCNVPDFGLSAEIEARHKQYEYYRDKLLTFERKEM